MPAVETDKLAKRYKDVRALEPLDLKLEPGEILGLIGPDGAGKTTVIKLLAALIKPSQGAARVFGVDTARDPEGVRRQIGYMSQAFALYTELTVRENMDFFADLYRVTGREKAARLEALLEFSRLGPFKDRLSGRLSGGMKQKLGLSCALIHTPRLLLLDEPTTGVDPISRRELWKLLYDIWKRGTTIILATPYMDEAERCTMVAFMDRGRMIRCDRPQAIKAGVGFQVYELATSQPRAAWEALRAAPDADQVGLFGRHLHVHLRDAAAQLGPMESLLAAKGIAVEGRRRIEPSLEDVFLSLVAGSGPGVRAQPGDG